MSDGCYDDSNNGQRDGFITKINQDGTQLVYSSYLGASSYDICSDVAVDNDGHAYVAGLTQSEDFPTVLYSYDESHNGDNDVFVTKFSADGSSLLYSTFYGGNGPDEANSISIDQKSNVYVVGETASENLPTTVNCFDDEYNDKMDGFIFKLDSQGIQLRFSTYIGGKNRDKCYGVSVDSEEHIYVTGITESNDFPTTNGCFDNSFNSDDDAFILKLNKDGDFPLYSTYLGGSKHDTGRGIEVDEEFNVYVTGSTRSTNFPTTNDCYDDEFNGNFDLFVSKIRLSHQPTIVIDSITPNSTHEDHDVTFSCHASDDGFIVKYQWTSSLDNILYNGTENHFTVNDLSNGTHTIRLKVQDDEGFWSEEVESETFINGRPRVKIQDTIPENVLQGTLVNIVGSSSDDGSIVRTQWISSIDGMLHDGEFNEISLDNLTNGTHTIVFRALDNHDHWSHDYSRNLIINGLPHAIIESIIPDIAHEGEVVTFSGTGFDDGSIQQYAWNSTLDGNLNNGSEASFSTANLSLGIHIIHLKVLDNYHVWSNIEKMNISIHEIPKVNISCQLRFLP